MRGFEDKIDKNGPNGCWLWIAGITGKGYGRMTVRPREYAHRYAYRTFVGPIPEGMHVDHRPTCPKRCVNPAHLRLATNKQNQENRAGTHARSGVRGVYWHSRAGRWVAQVRHDNKTIYVGLFDTVEQAGEAAAAKRLELFTHNDADRSA